MLVLCSLVFHGLAFLQLQLIKQNIERLSSFNHAQLWR